ncbi:Hypothetical protein A7982_04272 [Minicystis rosea]|nr:Hypothetical protein A7982_04272 [Minicystis rosea]
MRSTRIRRHMKAPRQIVYGALIDGEDDALDWQLSLTKLAALVETQGAR